MDQYTEEQLDKLDIGFKEKAALWILGRWLKGQKMKLNLNFKNWTAGDYAKVIASVAAAFGAGYAQGELTGGVVAAVVAIATILQTPPGHDALPK